MALARWVVSLLDASHEEFLEVKTQVTVSWKTDFVDKVTSVMSGWMTLCCRCPNTCHCGAPRKFRCGGDVFAERTE